MQIGVVPKVAMLTPCLALASVYRSVDTGGMFLKGRVLVSKSSSSSALALACL